MPSCKYAGMLKKISERDWLIIVWATHALTHNFPRVNLSKTVGSIFKKCICCYSLCSITYRCCCSLESLIHKHLHLGSARCSQSRVCWPLSRCTAAVGGWAPCSRAPWWWLMKRLGMWGVRSAFQTANRPVKILFLKPESVWKVQVAVFSIQMSSYDMKRAVEAVLQSHTNENNNKNGRT